MADLSDFLGKVRSIQSLMKLVSTSGIARQEKENEYKELRASLKEYFHICSMNDPNSFESLEEFYGYYRSKLPHYEQRRDFVVKMYEQAEASIESKLVKGEKIELNTAAVGLSKVSVLQEKKGTPDPRKVLVVYGRNEQARVTLFTFLRALGLHPLEWAELVKATGEGSPFIGKVLEKGFSEATAVVVLMTPDDLGRVREEFRRPHDPSTETDLTGQARLNVVFEAGMAFGYCAERTVIVEFGTLRPFTDVLGRHVIRLDNSTQKRQELAQRLQTLGCTVNLAGTDWHTAGEFAAVEKGFQGLIV